MKRWLCGPGLWKGSKLWLVCVKWPERLAPQRPSSCLYALVRVPSALASARVLTLRNSFQPLLLSLCVCVRMWGGPFFAFFVFTSLSARVCLWGGELPGFTVSRIPMIRCHSSGEGGRGCIMTGILSEYHQCVFAGQCFIWNFLLCVPIWISEVFF